MRTEMRTRAGAAVVVALVCAAGWPAGSGMRVMRAQQMGSAQQQESPQQPGMGAPHVPAADASDGAAANNPMAERAHEMMLQQGNADRHKKMEADVTKLLELSTELKTDVDKTANDQMSLDVIRKAGEIEKLAHDVKERMKG